MPTCENAAPGRSRFFLPGLFLALSLLIYAPSLSGLFLGDDLLHIAAEGSAARMGWGEIWRAGFFQAPGTRARQYYRPLAFSVYKLLATFGPLPFRLLNCLLHALNGCLLARIAGRILNSRPAGAAAAVFFILHPLQVEEVAYISGLGGLGAAFFMLLALDLWQAAREFPGCFRNWLSAAALGAALLWKESPLVFPALPLLILLAAGSGNRKAALRSLAPLILTVVFYLGARKFLLAGIDFVPFDPAGLGGRVAGAGRGFLTSLRLILLPAGLHFYRAVPVGSGPAALGGGLAAGGLAVGVLSGCLGRRRVPPAVAIGLGWFLLGMLPFSGLKPFYLERGMLFWGEHYSYFSLAGAGIAGAGFFRWWGAKGTGLFRWAALAAAISLGALTLAGSAAWRSETELAARSAAREPELFRARLFFAEALFRARAYSRAACEYDSARERLARHAAAPETGYLPFEREHLRICLLGAILSRGRAGDFASAAALAEEFCLLFPEDPSGPALLEHSRDLIPSQRELKP